ncbi:hypothetical protein D9M68_755040 [compost metagenome]
MGEEAGAEQPSVGSQQGQLAPGRVARVEQVVPAGRGLAQLVGAVADAGGTPGVGGGVVVARIEGEVLRLGIEVLQVGDLDRVHFGEQSLFVQDLGELGGHEDHVVAVTAGSHELAHDLLVGGVQRLVHCDAGGFLELLQRIRGHVAVPDGDHHVLRLSQWSGQGGGQGKTCEKQGSAAAHGKRTSRLIVFVSKAAKRPD